MQANKLLIITDTLPILSIHSFHHRPYHCHVWAAVIRDDDDDYGDYGDHHHYFV